MAMPPNLLDLPDHVLLGHVCVDGALGGRDLAALEAVSRRFRLQSAELSSGSGGPPGSSQRCTLCECAAERRVRGHGEGWRVAKRAGEGWKYMLWVLEGGLLPPLPVVSAGLEHTLVRAGEDSGGRLFAFGWDDCNQLGLGGREEIVARDMDEHEDDREASPREVERLRGRRVVSVAAGGHHSAALSEEGGVMTWGVASLGILGHGPVPAEGAHVVAAPRLVTGGFPQGTRVALVAAGGSHTACVTALGHVFSWGGGMLGRLGHGDEENQHTPRRVETLAGQRVVGLDCGDATTAAVTVAGELFVWGMLQPGDMDVSTPERVNFPQAGVKVRRVSCGDEHFAAVDTEGVLYNWGLAGEYGRLGHNSEQDEEAPRVVAALAGQRVVMVSCGANHTAVVTVEGQMFTWGWDGQGQLGHSDSNTTVPVRVTAGLPGGEAGVVRGVSCGYDHTVVVMASGEVCTVGHGDSGQLGHGDTVTPNWPLTSLMKVVKGLPSLLHRRASKAVSYTPAGLQDAGARGIPC